MTLIVRFAALFLIASPTWASPCKTKLTDLVDPELCGGKPLIECLEERKSKPERAERDRLRNEYRLLRAALEKQRLEFLAAFGPTKKGQPGYNQARKELEKAEGMTKLALSKWVPLEITAGDCFVKDPGPVAGTQWWTSDGSCYLPEADDKATREVFAHRVQSLQSVEAYPQHNPQGFRNILQFQPIDANTGKPAADKFIGDEDLHAFIAVRFPFRLGALSWAATYYVVNRAAQFDPSVDKDWTLQFDSVVNGKFTAPVRVAETLISGDRVEHRNKSLPGACGIWHLNDKGYFRYWTAGDFEGAPGFLVKDEAKRILAETLLQLSERRPGAKP